MGDKRYSKGFKENALHYLEKINRGEEIKVAGIDIPIKTVRALCTALGGISSQTLYKWRGQAELKDSFVKKELDTQTENGTIDLTKRIEIEKKIESQIKDFPEIIETKTNIPEKDIFGERYYSWFARAKGIKNYAKCDLRHLKLKIGLNLIEESGLVDFQAIFDKINNK